MSKSNEKICRPADLAAALRVDQKTASRWLNAGKIPGAFRTPGGHWRVPAAVVQALVAGVAVTFDDVIAGVRELTGEHGSLLIDWTDEDGNPSTVAFTAVISSDGVQENVTRETATQAVEAALAKLRNYLAESAS